MSNDAVERKLKLLRKDEGRAKQRHLANFCFAVIIY